MTTPHPSRRRLAVRTAGLATAFLALGCASAGSSSASSATAATPSAESPATRPRGPVEAATFDPSLGIHLDAMMRRSNGLYVQDLKVGTGAIALSGRSVVVRYQGWLANGKQFDAGEITMKIGSHATIPAWEEGILGMRVGGQRRLVVPPSLGYGDQGQGAIPPNAVLVFEMELESVLSSN